MLFKEQLFVMELMAHILQITFRKGKKITRKKDTKSKSFMALSVNKGSTADRVTTSD